MESGTMLTHYRVAEIIGKGSEGVPDWNNPPGW